MSIYEKLFGKKKEKPVKPVVDPVREEHYKKIQENTDRLWLLLKETLEYYDTVACPCAFPRFRQYAAIDCVDTGTSFYASETEGIIFHAKGYYNEEASASGSDVNNAIYTCKKCGSTFDYGWSDFSIHVNRTVLKARELKVVDMGAAAIIPIPMFVGLFGHNYPDRSGFNLVGYEEFAAYIRELK